MPKLLQGKVAIVTGAGRGLGRAHSLALASQGAKVVVNDLGGAANGTGASKDPADEVVDEIRQAGGEAVANYDTVTTSEGAERIIRTAIDHFGRLDILVNNAGILRDRMLFNMTDEEWDAVIKVHLYGTFYCTRNACRLMREQRYGRIINTSSSAGLGNMGQANYAAAKEGIVGFTRTVAREMGRYGVTCNAIRPYAATRLTVNPELMEAWKRRMGPELFEAFKKQMESRLPEDISPLVVYLASEQADFINGCVFDIHTNYIAIYDDPPRLAGRITKKEGRWLPEELVEILPQTLTQGKVRDLPPMAGAVPLPNAPSWEWADGVLRRV